MILKKTIRVYSIFFLVVGLQLFYCQETKDQSSNLAILALASSNNQSSNSTTSSISTSCGSVSITCDSSNTPTSWTQMNTKLSQGTKSCMSSGCHDGSSGGQFSLNSYTNAIGLIRSGNPECSVLFTKVYSGSMKQYSNTNVTESIYCWIKSGNPQ